MPERASANQLTQLGVEAVPGTLVAATRRLQSLSIQPDPEFEVDEFRPEGYKYPTLVAPVKDWTGASIEGRPTYNELAYLLSSLLSTGAVSAGGVAGSFLWAFTPSSTADDAPKTLTVEHGSGVRAERFGYGLVSELSLTFDRDAGVSMDGAMVGQALEDGVVLSPGATELVPVPVLIRQVDVFMDPTFATIGTTKLARLKTSTLNIGDRWNPVWVIDSTKPSYAAHVEGVPDVGLEVTLEADAGGMGLLPVLRAGDTRFFRIRAQGPLIGGAVFNQLTIDLSAKVNEAPDYGESDGLHTVDWNLSLVHDPTAGWARAFRIDLVNTLAAL